MSSKVWTKFQVTSSDGALVNLRIQDTPNSRKEEAASFYAKYFINDGLMHNAVGIPSNPKAVEEIQNMTCKMVWDPAVHVMICCEVHDDDNIGQIVAVSLTELVTRDSNPSKYELKTEEVRKWRMLIDAISERFHPLERLQLSRYYADIGAVVHPKFRRCGVVTEIAKARTLACVAHNVPATGGIMTAIGSQKAVEKTGFETVLEINMDDFGRQHGVTFKVPGGVIKYMIWKVPQPKV